MMSVSVESVVRSTLVPRSLRAVPWRILVAGVASVVLAACSGSSAKPTPPAPGIVVSTATLHTAEGGARVPLTVRLGTLPASEPVVVIVRSLDTTEGTLTTSSSATTGSSSLTLRFTTTDWSMPQTVYVLPYNDTVVDGDITYTIQASVDPVYTLDPTYLEVPDVTVAVTNADNDIPGFTVSKTTAATAESGGSTGSESFTVVLNVAPTGSVTIPVQSLDVTEGKVVVGSSSWCGSAQTSVSLTFSTSSWNTAQTVTVCGQQDSVDDGNVTYPVRVGPPSGAVEYATLLAKTISVTNSDDDTAGITVAAGARPLITTENGGTATFTVKLNTMPVLDVVVPVRSGNVAEGVLSSGTQNIQETVNLTFTSSNWNTAQTVTVTGQNEVSTQVLGDNVTYDVTVGPPTGDPVYATSVAPQTVSVTNFDNDTPAFVLSPAPGSNLTVSETGVNTATFSVRINKLPTASVVIPVSTSDTTEARVQGGSSPSSAQQTINLTFTQADWQTPQTVTVVGQADSTVDGPQTSTLTVGKPTSADAGFDALVATSLTVTTVDTDSAGYTVSTTSISTNEGATTSFTVVMNRRPESDVTVPVVSGNPAEGLLSTSASGPFTASLSLTFTNADALTSQTVYVKGPIDDVDDGNQTYSVTVGPTSSTDTRWQLTSKTVSATNVDVDTAALVVTPRSGLVTTEGGGTAGFTVRLGSKPLQNVTVTATVPAASTGEVRVSSGVGSPGTSTTLTFTPESWSTTQQVTVTGLDDAALDGNRAYTIVIGASGDSKYGSLTSSVTGQNDDDEVGRSEGTLLDPVNLDSVLPHAGQVDPGSATTAYSYYSLWRPAGTAVISLKDVTAGVTLTVDDDGDYASGTLCTRTIDAFGYGTCTITLSSAGRIYFRVSTSAAGGAGFTITDAPPKTTWTSTDVPKSIPSTGTIYSNLAVSGGPASLSKVTVKLSLTHTFDADLSIYLIAPDATQIALSTNNGGSYDNYTNTVFDDAAATSITAASAPFTGTFRPEGLLSALNGRNANGTWQLRVTDGASLDSGSLTSWSITIE